MSERRAAAAAARELDQVLRREEEAARHSEENFRLLADTLPQLAWIADARGEVVWLNKRWYDYTGIEGMDDRVRRSQLVHPDYRAAVTERFWAAMAGGESWEDTIPLLGADGNYRWFLSRAEPVRDPETGQLLRWVGANTDITSQRATESALAEETRTLETLNRTAGLLAAELDLDRVVQTVTDAGVALTGAEFGAFFYNVQNSEGESYMLYTLSGAPPELFEGLPMPRNTEVFTLTFHGGGAVRSDDITADPRYGRNHPYKGMPEGHLPVRSYLAVPVVSRSGEVLGGLFFGHATPGVFGERAERVMTGLAAHASVAIDNARLFAAAQRDLVERRKAEAALQELNEALERRVAERTEQLAAEVAERRQTEEALRQSQKMEAIGQLTGGVAHDFNNLLTAITGNIELMQRRLAEGNVEVGRFADNAMASAKRAANLTQRLLAFSRRQALTPKTVDVNRLVGDIEELLVRTLGEQVELRILRGEGLWTTWCDPNQLENAILNLAVNARDAMPDGGVLTIETTAAQVRVGQGEDLRPGDYVLLRVTDSGVGMSPEVAARAFDPFFTTKPIGQGTGLGLSQLYGFAKQSGGHVEIVSREGEGTAVLLYLPRRSGEAEAEEPRAERPAPATHHAGRKEVVLVVEDEALVRLLVVQTLEEAGFSVIEAEDAPAALDLLAAQPRVDLLVTDVGLPGLNGRQLAEMARMQRPDLRVLFMTGYAHNAGIGDDALAAGMEIIAKPFAIDRLAARVEAMLQA